MRRGFKTTEFYATVALNVGTLAFACAGVLPAKWAAIASAVSVGAFNLSRGLTKIINSGS